MSARRYPALIVVGAKCTPSANRTSDAEGRWSSLLGFTGSHLANGQGSIAETLADRKTLKPHASRPKGTVIRGQHTEAFTAWLGLVRTARPTA